MKPTIFNNPQNLWGKWVKLTSIKQHVTLILLGLCFIYIPLRQTLDKIQTLAATETELLHQQEKLHHQQQILQTLKHKVESVALTPELAAKLPPINRQIQQLAAHLQIKNSQWIFERQPNLNLQVEGYFNEIKQFLTALLAQSPKLHLLRLHLTKAEATEAFSVQGEISLQLQTVKEE